MKRSLIALFFLFVPLVLSQAPPVVITNIILSSQNPDPGTEVVVTVTLVNKDFKGACTATLKFLVDGTLSDVKVIPLEPRSASTATFSWKSEEGMHTLSVYLTYFAPLEFSERRDLALTVGAPQQESPLASPLGLFGTGNYADAKSGFISARQALEERGDAAGMAEADGYIALCDRYLAAQDAYARAQGSLDSGALEEASRLLLEARAAYEGLGESGIVSSIDFQLSEIEKKRVPAFPLFDPKLLLFVGIVLIVIVAIFLYTKSREGTHATMVSAEPGKKQKPPRDDKIVFFDEGERGASFIARCRKILEADVPDSQAYIRIAEEFKSLTRDFSSMTPAEAGGVRKSYDMCAEKISSEEKKWTSIKELESLLRRCDSFLGKYQNPEFLKKNVVDAYNLYTGMQAKFEELGGHDPELERKVAEALKKCYFLIEDEIHKMRA